MQHILFRAHNYHSDRLAICCCVLCGLYGDNAMKDGVKNNIMYTWIIILHH